MDRRQRLWGSDEDSSAGNRAVRMMWFGRVGAIGLILLGAVGTWASQSAAASTFTASAGGEVVRAAITLTPAVIAPEIADPGALTAQASLTSFGESVAFASHPYPGSVPVSAPGLIDGLLASSPGVPPELTQLVNLPEYPLIASSSYPATPVSSVSAGTVQMRADSRERESRAVSSDGVNKTEVSVVADSATDVVTATAVVEVGAVDTGPGLSVSGVRSEAVVVRAPDGEVERSTGFSVASASILGHRVRIGPDGIEFVGVNLPGLGAGVNLLQELLDQLAEDGVSVRLIPAEETPDGVRSAGLEVTRTFNTGVNDIVATVSMTVGRTFASVENAARPSIDTSFPPLNNTPVDVGGVESGGSGVGSSPSVSSGGSGPAPVSSPFGSAASPVPAETQTIAAQPASGLIPDETDAGRFYPVLMLSGIVFLGGTSLYRKIGVSTSWTS